MRSALHELNEFVKKERHQMKWSVTKSNEERNEEQHTKALERLTKSRTPKSNIPKSNTPARPQSEVRTVKDQGITTVSTTQMKQQGTQTPMKEQGIKTQMKQQAAKKPIKEQGTKQGSNVPNLSRFQSLKATSFLFTGKMWL